MKKILFVGNANSFLIFQLAKQIKIIHPNWRIDLLSESLFELNDSPFDTIYAVDHNHPNASRKYVKVFYLASEMKKLIHSIEKDYDSIHILYLSSAYRLIWKDLKKVANKKIITVFGGDFYKSNFVMRLLMRKMVNESNIISATNPSTLNDFCTYFSVKEDKQRVVRFGLSILDEIDKLDDQDILDWKLKVGLPENRLLIACGYNKSTNQNLPEMINSILDVKNFLPEFTLCFQFPGEETEYTRSVRSILEFNKLEYRIFTNRFSDRELAKYRKSMKIMLQLQNSDSFSGAMQEHLYAGSLVITGKWLPYEVLENEGIDFIRISNFDELAKTLSDLFERQPDKLKNKEVISKFSKWSINLPKWINLYD